MPLEEVGEVHITFLAGLGASYRLAGFFRLKAANGKSIKINFKGFAFGGHYGGHNVNIQISARAKKNIREAREISEAEVDNVLAEVQRRILNNEMTVEYDKIKPEEHEPLGNLGT